MSLRGELKEHLETVFGDGYAVYESGVDILKTPCVIINPSSPYQVPTTMGVDARIQTFLDIWIVTNRTSPKDALNHLEEMRRLASVGVKSFMPRGAWSQFGRLGSTLVGGVEYATGVMETVFIGEDV